MITPLKNCLWILCVLVLATPASIFAGGSFSDNFEDSSINPNHWIIGGERRGYAGAPAGSWTYTHTETVGSGGGSDGYLQMSVVGPYTGNTYGAEAWIRTTYDYNDGGWHTANFNWKAEIGDTHANQYFIQITDGYIPPTAPFHWQYNEPRPPELAPTVDLLWTYEPEHQAWHRGGLLGELQNTHVPQGSPDTGSIRIDPSGTARLYNGPNATGSLLREEALAPNSPWHIRFMVNDGTSAGFGAGAAHLNLYSVSVVPDPPPPEPVDPVDPPTHTSQYNFVIGADPYFQWDGITVGLDFKLYIPTLDPITYNPSITYPETPVTPEIGPWETRFSTNNKLLGKTLSLIAPVDVNAIELTGTARLSGDVDAIADLGLADGDAQADFAAELGAGINLGLSLTATNSLFEALPKKLQELIPNTFEFTYPIVGGNIGVDDVKIDHGQGSFDMQLFREALVAIPDDEYTSVDQLDGAVNIGGVPMTFSDTNNDDVIDHVLAGVGASLSVYAETSATAGIDVYFYEVDEYNNEVESTSIFTSFTNLWNKEVDLLGETTISSDTGIVDIDTDGLRLQTGSPVWMQTIVTLEEEANLLAFSAEFLSEEGAEGILQIFCNGELVATVDERTAVEGIEEYIFSLPEELEAGDCLIAFRLDPFTDVASSIQIDNLTLGYMQAVPEPSTIVMLIAGLIGILIVRRRGG